MEEKTGQTEEFKLGLDTGVMMISELVLEFLDAGEKLGYGEDVPAVILKQFIKEYAVRLYEGKMSFKTLKASIKKAADAVVLRADSHEGAKPGKVH